MISEKLKHQNLNKTFKNLGIAPMNDLVEKWLSINWKQVNILMQTQYSLFIGTHEYGWHSVKNLLDNTYYNLETVL